MSTERTFSIIILVCWRSIGYLVIRRLELITSQNQLLFFDNFVYCSYIKIVWRYKQSFCRHLFEDLPILYYICMLYTTDKQIINAYGLKHFNCISVKYFNLDYLFVFMIFFFYFKSRYYNHDMINEHLNMIVLKIYFN